MLVSARGLVACTGKVQELTRFPSILSQCDHRLVVSALGCRCTDCLGFES